MGRLQELHDGAGQAQGEIWGLTAYFNPANYATKPENFRNFAKRVRAQGLKLLVIELAFDAPFHIDPSMADRVIRLRQGAAMWQKERLLNIAASQLPESCDKIVWLDGDIVFTNSDWVSETARLLDSHKVVQPFRRAFWLPQGFPPDWWGNLALSANYVFGGRPGYLYAGLHPELFTEYPNPTEVAHPGFAWAARREVIRAHGFYDRCILGGGDAVMAASIFSAPCAWNPEWVDIRFSHQQKADVMEWAEQFHEDVAANAAYVSGDVLHLWHGEIVNRRYFDRYQLLKRAAFDPRCDIALDSNCCWQWNSEKPELHRDVQEYFSSRKEDGGV